MRIACLLDDGFEDSEFRIPFDALRAAGHDVTIVGFHAGADVTGYRGMERARIEASLDDVSPEQFDALFIPGGYSPDHLRADDRAVAFTAAFTADDRPVFAICHGPQLLLSADAVRGRRMTAWRTVQGDLRKAGADVVDEQVVVDGNLVTSRQPDDLEAFSMAAVTMLERIPAAPR